jgi:hypothetical protein
MIPCKKIIILPILAETIIITGNMEVGHMDLCSGYQRIFKENCEYR